MLMALSEAPSTAYNFGKGKTKASAVRPNIEEIAKKMNCCHGKGGCFVKHVLSKDGKGKLTFSSVVGNLYVCCALVFTGQCIKYNEKKPSSVRVLRVSNLFRSCIIVCCAVVR